MKPSPFLPIVPISAAAMADLEEYNVGSDHVFSDDPARHSRLAETTVETGDIVPVLFALQQSTIDEISAALIRHAVLINGIRRARFVLVQP